MSVLQQLRATSTLKAPIFVPTVFFVATVTVFCTVFPQQAQSVLNAVK